MMTETITELKRQALDIRKRVDWDNVNCPNRKELRRIEKEIDKRYEHYNREFIKS